MKYLTYILIIVLLSFNVNSLIAGTDNILLTINKCDHLFINVSGTLYIDPIEYSFPYCTNLQPNYWYCDCYNNYDLIISLHILAMNKYTFNIESYYPGVISPLEQTRYIYSSGPSRTNTEYIIINETQDPIIIYDEIKIIEEKEIFKELPVEKEIIKYKEINNTIYETPEPSFNWNPILILLLLFSIILIIHFQSQSKKNNNNQEKIISDYWRKSK